MQGRKKKDKPRSLENICEKEDFHTELNGNVYCSLNLKPEKKVICRYLSDKPDQNGLYPCMKAEYNIKGYNRAMEN